MKPIIERIVFATERPLLAVGLRELLRRSGLEAEPWVMNPAALAASVQPEETWLIVLDGEGPLFWEEVDKARLLAPQSRFVICGGAITPELVLAAMKHDLDGVISTRLPELETTEALVRICHGERQYRFEEGMETRFPETPPLSRRERLVLAMVADGLRNREIAMAIGTSEDSVKVHIHRLLRKTGTRRRQELAPLAGPLLARAETGAEASDFDGTWMFGGRSA
ncbi:MAG TPA: LuxR C-terminal-related transcriptional regulator [Bryobacteraceae bacterium]|nr:LuxR C-terminal-related transcriptional regulator [Bryobacteraceae bacterium]